ncbi:MAG TPA: GcrA family cell cycle regulator [Methylocella sp.]|jgi:hypothetical protein
MLDDIDQKHVAAPEASDDAPQSLHVPLEQLQPHQCRWPEQTAFDDLCTYRFCGQPVLPVGRHEGRAAYCAHHRQIALQHTPSGGLVYAMWQKF